MYNRYKEIIEKYNGTMISTEYIDSKTQLEFYCKNNHFNKCIAVCQMYFRHKH